MNNRRKGSRGGSTRNTRMRTSAPVEGVYNNAHFMHTATSMVGNIVRIQTTSKTCWEGIFKTYSSQFDVVLEMATRVDYLDTNPTLNPATLVDKLIFRAQDMVCMFAVNVDLEFATRDTFQTDTAISGRLNGQQRSLEEKELEPWDATGVNGGETLELEPGANGWDANDMFKKNEQIYGVQSTYDSALTQYTVPLQQSDSADYREAELKAEQIATEIENNPSYKARIELENGDEEERFAAVQRPGGGSDSFGKPNSENSNSMKYVPPQKRKNGPTGKVTRSTPPPPSQGSGTSQSTPSPKGPGPQMSYPVPNNIPHPRESREAPNMHQQINAQQQSQNVMVPQHQMQHSQPPMNQHPAHNHQAGRPHAHTPPHGYNQPMLAQRQGPPPVSHNGKGQMNGEVKQNRNPPRNLYNNGPPGNQMMPPPQQPPQYQEPPKQENMPQRHRDEIKDLHKFSQEFKLSPHAQEQQMPPQVSQIPEVPITVPPPSVIAQPAQKQHPGPQTSPPQQQVVQLSQSGTSVQPPQQSVSPQQDSIDKVNSMPKKSNLNPNAKEFVLNPAAKPFQPRSPSTPTVSRPHTPQTPQNNAYMQQGIGGSAGQPQILPVLPMNYMLTNQQYQPPGQNRYRKVQIRTDMPSQMQVAAATGQPLLAPAPMPIQYYQQGLAPQPYPGMQTVRMYESPPQLQFSQMNPGNAPNHGQPPPYSSGQGPPQPQQYQPPPPQGHPPPQLSFNCASTPLVLTGPPNMIPYHLHQQPPPTPIQVIVQQHPQQQHGPQQ